MRFPLYISLRYLISKKSHNAINIISGIAMVGIMVATMAMVVTMSVFNGFQGLLSSLYTTFDPQLKIVPTHGKYVAQDDTLLTKILADEAIESASFTINDNALILFQGHPVVVEVKGVDKHFVEVTNINEIVQGEGFFQLQNAGVEFGIPGMGLAQQLGGPKFKTLQLCAPRGGARINISDPLESLSVQEIQGAGVYFCVNQHKYDDRILLTSLDFAQTLFEKEGLATSLELRLQPSADTQKTKERIRKIAGDNFKISDRLEQQDGIFNIMQIEKLLAYVFLTFILLVACFNIISSVSMLIIEKRDDVRTLHNLGLSHGDIVKVFLYEGRLISLIGGVLGIIFGVALCLLQQEYGLIKLGNTANEFIIEAYPVLVQPLDLVIILLTTIVVGFIATWYPVHHLSKKLL